MAKRPHRVVIRTTVKHQKDLQYLATAQSVTVSKLVRDLMRKGMKAWKENVTGHLPYHEIRRGRTEQLQIRMPDKLFRRLEKIIDDLEFTRTDLYLRLIELGRRQEDLDAEKENGAAQPHPLHR